MRHDAAARRGTLPARSLELAPVADAVCPTPAAGARLWLALEFPALALECLDPLATCAGPGAVSVHEGRRPQLLAVNAQAREAGVHEGMGVTSALVLCPALRVARHDPVLEAATLDGLAAWAGRYTSQVSLQPPRGLLLEIGASLRLFGGLGPLLERARTDLGAFGHRVRRGVAPTPAAAWLLARSGGGPPVTLAAHLPGRLSVVPVSSLDLPARTLEDLHALGLDTFGDCARLPRDGVGRRLGPELLALLDRALGRRPDPRCRWQPPARFERRLDLPGEGVDRGLLLRAAERLLHELGGFLTRHARGAGALELHLAHRPGPATRCVLELAAPSRDPQHLLALVRERLESLPLERDVIYLGLRVERLPELSPRTGNLYAGGGAGDVPSAELLVERLGARLGRGAVRGLVRVADHRPERSTLESAWHQRAAHPARAAVPVGDDAWMPVWLLPEPRLLRGCDPLRGEGGWRIERGPRRIESGWWDGHDVARDYYVARARAGARHWIFRERRPPGRWFVHGVFA